jgi:transcriptional regulator with XRE-family HTH domain
MPTIAQNILASGHTQYRVALAMNVKERTYQRWEAGDATPDIPTLRRLAEVLGISVASLIEESE